MLEQIVHYDQHQLSNEINSIQAPPINTVCKTCDFLPHPCINVITPLPQYF